eukprot:scaffold931_cov200-Alexandrium_tamarense.AAC.32
MACGWHSQRYVGGVYFGRLGYVATSGGCELINMDLKISGLGGGKARDILVMSPFRQPRAMPEHCMRLPQFSNGFLYVFNE